MTDSADKFLQATAREIDCQQEAVKPILRRLLSPPARLARGGGGGVFILPVHPIQLVLLPLAPLWPILVPIGLIYIIVSGEWKSAEFRPFLTLCLLVLPIVAVSLAIRAARRRRTSRRLAHFCSPAEIAFARMMLSPAELTTLVNRTHPDTLRSFLLLGVIAQHYFRQHNIYTEYSEL